MDLKGLIIVETTVRGCSVDHSLHFMVFRAAYSCLQSSCPGTVQMRGQSRGGSGGTVAHSSP